MKKIIVHGGKAHLDDLMACAIAVAHETLWTPGAAVSDVAAGIGIERRDPTDAELEDPETFVLDVGGRYEPEKGDFDHHQLPRGSHDSAMTLLAANLGTPNVEFVIPYDPGDEFPVNSVAEFLGRVFRWFRRRAELDSCGPFATAATAGVEWSVVESFLGPFEDMVLAEFEKSPFTVVTRLADMIVRKWKAYEHVTSALEVDLPWWGDGEFGIADFTAADPAKAEEVSDALTAGVSGVAIFHDNRGPGLTLLRLRDDPRIDFTRVRDDPEVAFCHNGGFIVKTKSKNIETAWRLIEGAYLKPYAEPRHDPAEYVGEVRR